MTQPERSEVERVRRLLEAAQRLGQGAPGLDPAKERERIAEAHRDLEAKLSEVNQQLAAEKAELQRKRQALAQAAQLWALSSPSAAQALSQRVLAALGFGPAEAALPDEGPMTPGYLLMAAQDGELTAQETAALEDRLGAADPLLRLEWTWLERARTALRGLAIAGPDDTALARLRAGVEARLAPPARKPLHLAARGVVVAAAHAPAPDDGTDWVDVLERAGGVDVVLGDPSGRGEPARVAGAMARGALRALLDAVEPPHAVLRGANRALAGALPAGSFVGAQVARWDEVRRRVVLSGTETAFVVGPARAEPLPLGACVLGVARDAGRAFGEREVALRPGESLVLVSAGVLDAADRRGDELGEERLGRLLARHAHLAPDAMVEAALREVEAFTRGADLEDDRVVLVLRPG